MNQGIFAQMDGLKIDEIKIEDFVRDNQKHEVTVIFYYKIINRVTFFLMTNEVYNICKKHYTDDVYKVIFHLPIESSDIEFSN
jgi:hypothetical protein